MEGKYNPQGARAIAIAITSSVVSPYIIEFYSCVIMFSDHARLGSYVHSAARSVQ